MTTPALSRTRDRLVALFLFILGLATIAVYIAVLRQRVSIGFLGLLILAEISTLVIVYFIVTRRWRQRRP